jgi:very-short-patch-repair endonuclease
MKKRQDKIMFSRSLRQRQTDAEKVLWTRLRNKQLTGIKFRRQQLLGPYIVDFVSFDKSLIIEVDGGQHNQSPAIQGDVERTNWLQVNGYRVIRFWSNEVLTNLEGVLARIYEALK